MVIFSQKTPFPLATSPVYQFGARVSPSEFLIDYPPSPLPAGLEDIAVSAWSIGLTVYQFETITATATLYRSDNSILDQMTVSSSQPGVTHVPQSQILNGTLISDAMVANNANETVPWQGPYYDGRFYFPLSKIDIPRGCTIQVDVEGTGYTPGAFLDFYEIYIPFKNAMNLHTFEVEEEELHVIAVQQYRYNSDLTPEDPALYPIYNFYPYISEFHYLYQSPAGTWHRVYTREARIENGEDPYFLYRVSRDPDGNQGVQKVLVTPLPTDDNTGPLDHPNGYLLIPAKRDAGGTRILRFTEGHALETVAELPGEKGVHLMRHGGILFKGNAAGQLSKSENEGEEWTVISNAFPGDYKTISWDTLAPGAGFVALATKDKLLYASTSFDGTHWSDPLEIFGDGTRNVSRAKIKQMRASGESHLIATDGTFAIRNDDYFSTAGTVLFS